MLVIGTAAVIGALEHNGGGTNPRGASTSGTTITPAAHSRTAGSTLASPPPTQAQGPNQAPTSTSPQASASLAVSRKLAAQAIPPPDGYAGGPGGGMYPSGFITTTVYDQGAGAGTAATEGFLGGYEATYNSDTSGDFIDFQLLQYSSYQDAEEAEGYTSGLLPSDSAQAVCVSCHTWSCCRLRDQGNVRHVPPRIVSDKRPAADVAHLFDPNWWPNARRRGGLGPTAVRTPLSTPVGSR